MNDPAPSQLLTVSELKTWFDVRGTGLLSEKKYVKAVDGVDFTIEKGKTLGLVGESGSGKTTAGRTILGLLPASGGSAVFDGTDLFSQTPPQWRAMRKRMQIVFQDPMSSLNPRMTVASIVGEPLIVHSVLSRRERKIRVGELLERVGLSDRYMNRYPHEFSGGQRQRIGIARALAVRPDFIVCDEPVSALDVSIQAQIINILIGLQKEFGLTYLFIAHDLAVVKHISDRIGVMYLGKLVELYTSKGLHKNPMHPYTQALLSAIPVPDPQVSMAKKRIILQGDVPSPINPPKGCRFCTRCFRAEKRCIEECPELVELEPGHFVACHFPG